MTDDLILNVAIMGVGMHLGAWRHREDDPFSYLGFDYYRDIARRAEAGKLHAVFLADTLAVSEENFERPNLGAMDPTTVLGGLAAVTEHIGLVATASTSYNEPFNLARRLSTLDHLSRGRAAWNIVTTFSNAPLPPHDQRYARAEEFVDVVLGLWHSWEADALIGDKLSGQFADAQKVHALDHKGTHFSVAGPSTLPRSAQVQPVLFQAGSSDQGCQLAARIADVVFTVQNTLTAGKQFRQGLLARAKELGRPNGSLKVLPGLVTVIGGTETEAKARKEKLDHLAGDAELKKLARRVGIPFEDLDLDKPLPVDAIKSNPAFRASRGFQSAAVKLFEEEQLTVREILYRNGGGHLQIVGTPEQIADTIALWHEERAADGFNLMIDEFPSGLDAFVDEVVPLLQKRGLFHKDYRGNTLRSNLGLAFQ